MLQLNLERFSKTLMNLYKGMQISTAKWESGTFFCVCSQHFAVLVSNT